MTAAESDDGRPSGGAAPFSMEPDWSDAVDVPVELVNQIVASLGPNTAATGAPDGVYLAFGHAAPPIALGSPEQVRHELDALGGRLKVDVHARLFLTRERLDELIGLLEHSAAQFDEQAARVLDQAEADHA